MRFVKMESECAEDVLLETLKNNEKVNEGVKFAEGDGKPFMHFKKKNKTINNKKYLAYIISFENFVEASIEKESRCRYVRS